MNKQTQEEIKNNIKNYFHEYAKTNPNECMVDFNVWVQDLGDIVDWAYLKAKKQEIKD